MEHVSFKAKKLWVTVVLSLLVPFLSWYFLYRPESSLETVTQVKTEVSRHYVLPLDEDPALLTIVDISKLSSATLIGKVKNGDKVLLYKSSQKAIIYRPSIDRIVDVVPIMLDTALTN
ncbi:MAG: hypothetical protein WAU02_04090 [Candidatus Saccharimonadales bacterium]